MKAMAITSANGDNDNNNNELEPKVHPQRWVQLGYLSCLALLSDWICFLVAASPSAFEGALQGHLVENFIDVFYSPMWQVVSL